MHCPTTKAKKGKSESSDQTKTHLFKTHASPKEVSSIYGKPESPKISDFNTRNRGITIHVHVFHTGFTHKIRMNFHCMSYMYFMCILHVKYMLISQLFELEVALPCNPVLCVQQYKLCHGLHGYSFPDCQQVRIKAV